MKNHPNCALKSVITAFFSILPLYVWYRTGMKLHFFIKCSKWSTMPTVTNFVETKFPTSTKKWVLPSLLKDGTPGPTREDPFGCCPRGGKGEPVPPMSFVTSRNHLKFSRRYAGANTKRARKVHTDAKTKIDTYN